MGSSVDILLATFEGARFLAEQLASIEAQTCPGWRLIVRDDGSTDDSPAILEGFAQRHAGHVRILRDGRGRLGPCGNFAALLGVSDAPYFMFCDQDDVWLPEKLGTMLGAISIAEKKHGAETPILVHSDLVVTDEVLRVLHPSFWRHARLLNPAKPPSSASLVLRNFAIGCAAIGNAALREAAMPIPDGVYMHDWWVALVALVLGEIVAHNEATILYRQHQRNSLGGHGRSLVETIARFISAPATELQRVRFFIQKSQQQAALLQNKFQGDMAPQFRAFLAEFSRLPQAGFLQRKSFLHRYRAWPDYWLPAAVCWLFL